MTNKNILVVMPVNDRQKQKLEKSASGCQFTYSSYEKATKEMIQNAEIIIGNADPYFLLDAPKLEWMQLNSAGADLYLKKGVLRDDMILTNASGAYGPGVAEHLFAMLFSIQKKLHLYRDRQNECDWHDEGKISSLFGGNLLIVGLGDIGLYFAHLAKKFDYHVIGIKRNPGELPKDIDEIYTMEHLDALLPNVDVVLSVLPDTTQTRNIFQKEQFEKMKTTAIFLNGGRGSVVNTEDLCNALIAREIYAAGLDVTDPEPLPNQHKLWNMKNVVITPHISGDFHHPETLDRVVDIAADNLKRYLALKPLKNIVNPETGY